MIAARIVAATLGVAAALGPAAADISHDCTVIDALDGFAATGAPPAGAACATYLAGSIAGSHAVGVACHWRFAFRNPSATAFADALWRKVTSCRSGAPRPADIPVNHPDSFALREWAAGRVVYAVSVKDKGALGRTLVFLRRAPDIATR